MSPLFVFSLLAVNAAALPAPVQVHVYTAEVRVVPGGAVQEFPLDCKPGEAVLSGGFRHHTPELRVLASFPSPAKAAWVVSAALPARVPADLTVNVVCAEGDVRSSVRVATGSRLDASTQCPQGTVVTGGGYSSSNAAFTGSYPAVGEGWAVTAVPLAGNQIPTLTVYAVCASGSLRPANAGMETLKESGSGAASCDGTLVGGGYEVAEGLPPPYSIAEAAVAGDAWQVTVDGRGTDSRQQRLSLRLIAICVMFPEPKPVTHAPPIGKEPVSEREEIVPIIASSCLVAALLLALILVMSARMRGRPRRGPQAQVSVVLRSHHSSFRLDEFREVR